MKSPRKMSEKNAMLAEDNPNIITVMINKPRMSGVMIIIIN